MSAAAYLSRRGNVDALLFSTGIGGYHFRNISTWLFSATGQQAAAFSVSSDGGMATWWRLAAILAWRGQPVHAACAARRAMKHEMASRRWHVSIRRRHGVSMRRLVIGSEINVVEGAGGLAGAAGSTRPEICNPIS